MFAVECRGPEFESPSNKLSGLALRKKATIHQVTTMLATSNNVLFPGHNHLLTTSTDYLTLGDNQRPFLEVVSMVISWWIVFFCAL